MNFDVLKTLRLESIVGIEVYPYAHIGYDSVELHCASGRVFKMASIELEHTPFDAYSLDIGEKRDQWVQEPVAESKYVVAQLRVDHIEVFRRAEWQDSEPPRFPTVGQIPFWSWLGPLDLHQRGPCSSALSAQC